MADGAAGGGGGLIGLMKAKGLVGAASPPPSPPPPSSPPSRATNTSTALALLTTPPRVAPNTSTSTALTVGTGSPKARWKLALQQAVVEAPPSTALVIRRDAGPSAWDQLKSKISERKDVRSLVSIPRPLNDSSPCSPCLL